MSKEEIKYGIEAFFIEHFGTIEVKNKFFAQVQKLCPQILLSSLLVGALVWESDEAVK